jgi:hypothetical protein
VFLTPLLYGFQTFCINARLPVRHARFLYSLASGISWCVVCCFASLSEKSTCLIALQLLFVFRASLDVFADASSAFQHDPLSTLYSSVVSSTATSSSGITASGSDQEIATQDVQASAQDILTAAAQQSLQNVTGAWKLGYVRILTFLIASASVTLLHGGLLALWAMSPLLSQRMLPTFLAFPRLELMLVFAFVPGEHPKLPASEDFLQELLPCLMFVDDVMNDCVP